MDVVCLQETEVSQNTFSECNILRRFSPIINNSSTGYGTCTLVSNNLSIDNITKDSDGRFISVDVDGSTIVNLYLPSGTDQNSKSKREDMIDSIPNLLLYKKQNGVCGGDFNSIVDKKDSLIHPDQKMSKCLSKLIKLYGLKMPSELFILTVVNIRDTTLQKAFKVPQGSIDAMSGES